MSELPPIFNQSVDPTTTNNASTGGAVGGGGILKNDILGTGQLEQLIFQAIRSFNDNTEYTGPRTIDGAQRLFAQRIANAVAQGVADGVKKYLNESVKTINQNTLVNTGGNVETHTHRTVSKLNISAP